MDTNTESQELQKILNTTDISNIHLIQFSPNVGNPFVIETENIKKLALYIATKLNKTNFDPGELENAFSFITKNLKSTLNQDEYNDIKKEIENFICVGGKIEIIQNYHLKNNYKNYLQISLIVSIIIIVIQNIPIILWLLFVILTMVIFVISTEWGMEATINAIKYTLTAGLIITGLAVTNYLLSKKPNIYAFLGFLALAISAIGFCEYNLGGNSSFSYLLEKVNTYAPITINTISDEIRFSKENNLTKLRVVVNIENENTGKFGYQLYLLEEDGSYNDAQCSILGEKMPGDTTFIFECLSRCTDHQSYNKNDIVDWGCQADDYKIINSMNIRTFKLRETKRIWEEGRDSILISEKKLPIQSKDIFIHDYYNDSNPIR